MCGCLVALVAIVSPRFAIFLVWAFTDRMTIAFNSFWIGFHRVDLPPVDHTRVGGGYAPRQGVTGSAGSS